MRDICHDGGAAISLLKSKSAGIRFQIDKSCLCFYLILIKAAVPDVRYEDFKNTRLQPVHLMETAVPSVKITHNGYADRVRCPYGEVNAIRSVNGHPVCAELLKGMRADTVHKARLVLFRDLAWISVRVFYRLSLVRFIFQDEIIRRYFFTVEHDGEVTRLILLNHGDRLSAGPDADIFPAGEKCLHQNAVVRHMRTEDPARPVLLRVNDSLNLRPVHAVVNSALHTFLTAAHKSGPPVTAVPAAQAFLCFLRPRNHLRSYP